MRHRRSISKPTFHLKYDVGHVLDYVGMVLVTNNIDSLFLNGTSNLRIATLFCRLTASAVHARCEKNMTIVFLINILEFECTENFSYIFSSYC